MQSYKDLEIYKISHKLAVEVHKMSLDLPEFEIELLYETGSFKDKEKFDYSWKEYDHLGRKLNKFIQAFE